MATIQKIKDRLKNIIEPESKRDIVSLRFIKNIELDGTTATITTSSARFKENIETEINKIEGITQVNVAVDSPHKQPITPQAIVGVKNIIAVSSCKGGVGKSTIAAYIALNLKEKGLKVGLLDADIYGPSIPTLFNIGDVTIKTNDAGQIIPIDSKGIKVLSFGFLLKDNAAILRGPIVSRYIQQMFFACDWTNLDYLIVDLPPGTGDIHLTITHNIKIDGTIIITTPHSLAIKDVERGIKMFKRMNIPITGIIENMAYFQSSKNEKKHFPFGEPYGKKLENLFNTPLLTQIPIINDLNAPSQTSNLTSHINTITNILLHNTD